MPKRLVNYLARLTAGRFILWCYFIWWCVVVVRYFDPDLSIWLTSVGLSLIIGVAMFINTTASAKSRVKLEPWPTFRLFVTPFCVSSFSALAKKKGFILIFSPKWQEMAVAAFICGLLYTAKVMSRRALSPENKAD